MKRQEKDNFDSSDGDVNRTHYISYTKKSTTYESLSNNFVYFTVYMVRYKLVVLRKKLRYGMVHDCHIHLFFF